MDLGDGDAALDVLDDLDGRGGQDLHLVGHVHRAAVARWPRAVTCLTARVLVGCRVAKSTVRIDDLGFSLGLNIVEVDLEFYKCVQSFCTSGAGTFSSTGSV